MSLTKISAEQIFDGFRFHQQAQLVIENGHVKTIEAIDGSAKQHIQETIAPGFIDIQVNGGGGVLLNTSPTLAGIKTMLRAHMLFGTTGMLPTLITDKVEVMQQAADAIADAIKSNVVGILGIHFEGPHLSVAKKGAHSASFIRPITDAEWRVLSRQDIGKVLVTVAPENVATNDIKKMLSLGIKVCLGHSNADYKIVQAALDAGADGFTHLYNAMSPFTSREPGMVGAALLNDNAMCSLIVDGHHVDYVSCKLALKNKPEGKLILVTDAMPVVGSDLTYFDLFDRKVSLTGTRLNLGTGELAGSALDMASAMRNTVQHLNQPLEKALNMASLYPAQYLNVESTHGHLCSGAKANFISINDNLDVINVWLDGNLQAK